MLACLGWTRPRLFAVVLGELAVIGLTAGVLGGLASLPIAALLHLHASPGRAAWPSRSAMSWPSRPARGRPGSPRGPTRSPPSARRSLPSGAGATRRA